MNFEELLSTPHKRFNPLLREWVLVSPQRTARPWQGKVEKLPPALPISYDPSCYLCPGNKRAGGKQTPQYTETFAFDNDFPALLPDSKSLDYEERGSRQEQTAFFIIERLAIREQRREVVVEGERGLLLARTDRGIC